MKNLNLLVTYTLLIISSLMASGQAGILDPSFGINGTVLSDFGDGTGSVSALSVLPDGRIRVGGYHAHDDNTRFMILQYLANGRSDNTFGDTGRIFPAIDADVQYRLLSDGRFRVYGFDIVWTSRIFIIQQFLPDGNPDESFGPGGIVATWFGPDSSIQSYYLQSDLRVVLILSTEDFTLARLLPDGQPDLSFGNMGFVNTDLGQLEYCNTVYELEDGKLLAGGRSGTFIGWWTFIGSSAIIRYLPDGKVDSTFGENGVVLANMNGRQTQILTVQNDHKILALSSGLITINGQVDSLILYRYHEAGMIDSSFATNGQLHFPEATATKLQVLPDGDILLLCSTLKGFNGYGNAEYNLPLAFRYSQDGQVDPVFGYDGYDSTRIAVSDILIQGDDKLLLCGSYDGDAILFRYLSDGQLDYTFGESGLRTLDFGNNSACHRVISQPDGSLLLAGSKSEITYDSDIILAKRLNNGTSDPAFGPGDTPGKVIIDFGMDNHVIAKAMAIQSNGNIAVAGSIDTNLVLFQFKPDGAADPEFNVKGYTIVTDPIEFKYQEYQTMYQVDGKILMAGMLQDTGYNKILLVRWNSDGTKDGQFGGAGRMIADLGDIGITRITSIAINPAGDIYLAGIIYVEEDYNMYPFVINFSPDGTLDNSFGIKGTVLLTQYLNLSDSPLLKLFEDGRILLLFDINQRLNVIRILPDGSMDLTFGNNGRIITVYATGDQTPASVAILEENAIVIGGMQSAGGLLLFSCKYNENGTPDHAYGENGIAILRLPDDYFYFFNDGTTDILHQADGKFIFAGSSGYNSSDAGLIRLDANGTPDPLFGDEGIVTISLGGNESVIHATLQEDNKILVAGTKTDNNFSRVMLIRYLNDLNLGIIDLSDFIQDALVYPNPVTDQVVLEYELLREENIGIQLLDIQGRFIKTLATHQSMSAAKHRQTLDLSDIDISGHFIIQLTGEKGSIGVKMIK